MTAVSSESFADSSRAGIAERHARAPCISLKLPLRPATVGCSLQQILEAEIN